MRGARTSAAPARIVLVCDVAGGTTDFSLIEITSDGGALALERVAVGDHILLGGDNMDLAMAALVGRELAAAGKTLDAMQQRALVHAAASREGASRCSATPRRPRCRSRSWGAAAS